MTDTTDKLVDVATLAVAYKLVDETYRKTRKKPHGLGLGLFK